MFIILGRLWRQREEGEGKLPLNANETLRWSNPKWFTCVNITIQLKKPGQQTLAVNTDDSSEKWLWGIKDKGRHSSPMQGSGDLPKPCFWSHRAICLATPGTGGTRQIKTDTPRCMVFIFVMTMKLRKRTLSHATWKVSSVVNKLHPHWLTCWFVCVIKPNQSKCWIHCADSLVLQVSFLRKQIHTRKRKKLCLS